MTPRTVQKQGWVFTVIFSWLRLPMELKFSVFFIFIYKLKAGMILHRRQVPLCPWPFLIKFLFQENALVPFSKPYPSPFKNKHTGQKASCLKFTNIGWSLSAIFEVIFFTYPLRWLNHVVSMETWYGDEADSLGVVTDLLEEATYFLRDLTESCL